MMGNQDVTGASPVATGLGAPEGAEPPSRLGATPAIPSAGRAWLDVSLPLLIDALMLPRGTMILDAQIGNNGVIAFLVDAPGVHPDAMRVTATYEKDWDGPRFVDWRITAKRDPNRDESAAAVARRARPK